MWLNVAIRRPELKWRKSSFCAANECVEIASNNGAIFLRNSTQPRKMVRYTPEEWRAFAKGLRAGDFNDLA